MSISSDFLLVAAPLVACISAYTEATSTQLHRQRILRPAFSLTLTFDLKVLLSASLYFFVFE